MDRCEEGAAWVGDLPESELREIEWLGGWWKRWITPTEANRGMILGTGRLDPGQVADWHEHEEPEVFFVLEGEGEAHWQVAGQTLSAPLQPGVAFYKIGGIPHRMHPTGDRPLKGVVFKIGSNG